MNKLLRGVLSYGKLYQSKLLKDLKRVQENNQPSSLFFSCMDSRLFPSQFTSAQAGDMFVVRSAGNLVPCCSNSNIGDDKHLWQSNSTEPAGLELACVRNSVRDVVVCGHSDCKAMNMLLTLPKQAQNNEATPLERWLDRHGRASIEKFERHESDPSSKIAFQAESGEKVFYAKIDPDRLLVPADRLSQINCLQQLQHVAGYPFLQSRFAEDLIRLHAMWFDVYTGNVHLFSREKQRFLVIDENSVEHLLTDSQQVQCSRTPMKSA